MKIEDFTIYEYNLKFKNELKLKNLILTHRNGFLIKIENEKNNIGWGEIAPLENFSFESSKDCQNQLIQLKKILLNTELPNDLTAITDTLYPSVRFGLETALLNLTADSKGVGLSSLINRHSSPEISLNALITGNKDDILERLQKKIESGYRSFKLKIGNSSIEDDLDLITDAGRLLRDNHTLRLDANRSYDYETGVSLLKRLQQFRIEYIEEPFAELDHLKKYLKQSPEPIAALDETLRILSLDEISKLPNVKAHIIKPSMTGFLKSMNLAKLAIEKSIIPVISSSFESSWGLLILASMASIINSDKLNIPAGLDTFGYYENDLIDSSGIIENGKINLVKNADLIKTIDTSQLCEVADE